MRTNFYPIESGSMHFVYSPHRIEIAGTAQFGEQSTNVVYAPQIVLNPHQATPSDPVEESAAN